ncbi:hypothetical protein ZWY2020_025888 [Hordeum vulgare]|nr:hypothetical protein ZWY2020_025888 [Hordeum vulgare]
MSDATLVLERIARQTKQLFLLEFLCTLDDEVDHSALTSEADHLLPLREKECTDDDVISPKSGSAAALQSTVTEIAQINSSTLSETDTSLYKDTFVTSLAEIPV